MSGRISENIHAVKTRIDRAAANRPPPVLIAVSKTRDADEIRSAAAAGLRNFGENYLQEALVKMADLADLNLVWHFIGAVQSNKTSAIANHFDWVHTIDRPKIAERLSRQRSSALKPLQVLLQVNIDDEDSKAGVAPEDLPFLSDCVASMPHLQLRGIMSIPKPRTDCAAQRETALQVASLFNQLRKTHPEVDTLSLGMSADMEAAIDAGSTMVRVGTDIFGARPEKTNTGT